MSGPVFEFGEFAVLSSQRQLTRNGAPLETNSRYLDALILMLEHPGQLITRERFLDEVWRGVPVTDEALSQCIANLRRTLGDDASKPRFIETVPKHGYRFVAPVEARAGVMYATPSWPGDWSAPWIRCASGSLRGGR